MLNGDLYRRSIAFSAASLERVCEARTTLAEHHRPPDYTQGCLHSLADNHTKFLVILHFGPVSALECCLPCLFPVSGRPVQNRGWAKVKARSGQSPETPARQLTRLPIATRDCLKARPRCVAKVSIAVFPFSARLPFVFLFFNGISFTDNSSHYTPYQPSLTTLPRWVLPCTPTTSPVSHRGRLLDITS